MSLKIYANRKEQKKAWAKRNRERLLASRRTPEEKAKRRARYTRRSKEQIEHQKRYISQWIATNRERKNATNKRWEDSHREQIRAARLKNRDKYNANRRAARKANPAKYRVQAKAKYYRNHAKIRAHRKKLYWQNPKKFRLECKASYKKHRAQRILYTAKWTKESPAKYAILKKRQIAYDKLRQMFDATYRKKRRISALLWKQRNKEKMAAYRRANPHIYRVIQRAYYLRKRGAKTGNLREIRAIYVAARSERIIPCFWCEKPTTKGNRHVDHVVAIVKGGEHDAKNLVIACVRCNCMKKDKSPEEFMRLIGKNR